MRALVVFESMFGNTQVVAEAIAVGLADRMDVDLREVGAAPTTIGGDLALLVVGGPTHAFGMSRPATRRSAADQAEQGVVSAGIGVREWLAGLAPGSPSVAAAAFDTRVRRPRLPGSAAQAVRRRLRRLGFATPAGAASFYVDGTPGPLLSGEVERARTWGERLGSRVAPPVPSSEAGA